MCERMRLAERPQIDRNVTSEPLQFTVGFSVASAYDSDSTRVWDVPCAYSLPCRAMRAGRAIYFIFYWDRTQLGRPHC
jgi:hypothetical protein